MPWLVMVGYGAHCFGGKCIIIWRAGRRRKIEKGGSTGKRGEFLDRPLSLLSAKAIEVFWRQCPVSEMLMIHNHNEHEDGDNRGGC